MSDVSKVSTKKAPIKAQKKASAKTTGKTASNRTPKQKQGVSGGLRVGSQVLTYRPRQESDDPFLVRITLENIKEVFEKSVGLALTEESIRTQLSSSETIIIERGGVPIGYYSYVIYKPERMYWGALIFDQSVQSQGLGHQVVQHVYAEAKARGINVIEGHVQTENKRAYAFWLKHGFQVVGQPYKGSIPIVKNLE